MGSFEGTKSSRWRIPPLLRMVFAPILPQAKSITPFQTQALLESLISLTFFRSHSLSLTRMCAHAHTHTLAFSLSPFLSLSSCLSVCLPLGLCLSLLSKSGLTRVCGQMVLWFFFLWDLALLTHQQLFHTKHTALNLSANRHPPTPQFFHRSCPFVTVTLFYPSPSPLPSKFHSPSFFSPMVMSAQLTGRGREKGRGANLLQKKIVFKADNGFLKPKFDWY